VKSKRVNTATLNFICLESRAGPLIVPYRVERSDRVKRCRLHIDADRHVVLKLPSRQAESRGLAFLREHGEWICTALSKQPKIHTLRRHLSLHPRLSLWGRWYAVELGLGRSRATYEIVDTPRRVWLQLDMHLATEPQLLRLLRKIAEEALPARVAYLSRRHGITVHGVHVRDQRGRWGSCSETAGISLNWRLILLSPRLQDHIILHELAHLKHFDHSSRFYACLQSMDPLSERHAKQIQEAGDSIIHLGRID
jgi:predicted metal-dependent hydrolase